MSSPLFSTAWNRFANGMISLSITPSREALAGGEPAGAALPANMVAKAALDSILRHALEQVREWHDLAQHHAFQGGARRWRTRRRSAAGEHGSEGGVVFDNAHRVIDDHDGRGHLLDECVGLLQRQLAHVGDTHGAFRFLLD